MYHDIVDILAHERYSRHIGHMRDIVDILVHETNSAWNFVILMPQKYPTLLSIFENYVKGYYCPALTPPGQRCSLWDTRCMCVMQVR